MSLNEDFTDIQQEIKNVLFSQVETRKVESNSLQEFAKNIAEKDQKVFRKLSMEAANNLNKFLSLVDLEHPEVGNILPLSACDLILQFLDVAQYVNDKPLGLMWPQIKTMATREFKTVFYKLDDPAKSMIRLIKMADERKVFRQRKTPQKQMPESYIKNDGMWAIYSDSFKLYVRYGSFQKAAIETARKWSERYKTMGCTELFKEVEKSLSDLDRKQRDNYLGFYRLPLTEAGVILAKAHGWEYEQGAASGFRVKPKPDWFPFKISPSVDSGSKAIESWANINPSYPQPLTAKKAVVSYMIRCYNYYELESAASDDTVKIINQLESLPELCGKPAFDHYIVMVPTADIVSNNWSSSYSYTNDKREIRTFPSSELAQKTMDLELISTGLVRPIIMAEREGKCHFISYFESK